MVNVEYNTWKGTEQGCLDEYCKGSLQGDGEGELETIRDQANNNSAALANLINLLVEKGELGLDEVETILNTCDNLKLAE